MKKRRENWDNSPLPVEHEYEPSMWITDEEYSRGVRKGYWVPVCPSCREYFYGAAIDSEGIRRCFSCGQKLLPPEVQFENKVDVKGAELRNGQHYCSECGKMVKSFDSTFHADGPETYTWGGTLSCGHPYERTTWRDKGEWVKVEPEKYQWPPEVLSEFDEYEEVPDEDDSEMFAVVEEGEFLL